MILYTISSPKPCCFQFLLFFLLTTFPGTFLSFFCKKKKISTHTPKLLFRDIHSCVLSLNYFLTFKSIVSLIFLFERASIYPSLKMLCWYNVSIKVYGFVKLQTCFFRQFGCSVVRADYLALRKGFIGVCNILTCLRDN